MSTPRGSARRLRRQQLLRPWPDPAEQVQKHWVSQPHEPDDDGVCKHCGFDAAEEYHLRVMCVPHGAREPKPDFAKYCDKRPLKEVLV